MKESPVKTTPRTRIGLGAASALLVFGGAVGIAAAAGAGSAEPTPTSIVRPVPGDGLAEGESVDTQLVIGHDGKPAGYLEEENPIGDQPLTLGASSTAFRGLVVRSERGGGDVVGYLLTGDPGFVSVDEVADPASLSRIEQVWAADQEASKAELPPEATEMIEEYEAQLGSN